MATQLQRSSPQGCLLHLSTLLEKNVTAPIITDIAVMLTKLAVDVSVDIDLVEEIVEAVGKIMEQSNENLDFAQNKEFIKSLCKVIGSYHQALASNTHSTPFRSDNSYRLVLFLLLACMDSSKTMQLFHSSISTKLLLQLVDDVSALIVRGEDFVTQEVSSDILCRFCLFYSIKEDTLPTYKSILVKLPNELRMAVQKEGAREVLQDLRSVLMAINRKGNPNISSYPVQSLTLKTSGRPILQLKISKNGYLDVCKHTLTYISHGEESDNSDQHTIRLNYKSIRRLHFKDEFSTVEILLSSLPENVQSLLIDEDDKASFAKATILVIHFGSGNKDCSEKEYAEMQLQLQKRLDETTAVNNNQNNSTNKGTIANKSTDSSSANRAKLQTKNLLTSGGNDSDKQLISPTASALPVSREKVSMVTSRKGGPYEPLSSSRAAVGTTTTTKMQTPQSKSGPVSRLQLQTKPTTTAVAVASNSTAVASSKLKKGGIRAKSGRSDLLPIKEELEEEEEEDDEEEKDSTSDGSDADQEQQVQQQRQQQRVGKADEKKKEEESVSPLSLPGFGASEIRPISLSIQKPKQTSTLLTENFSGIKPPRMRLSSVSAAGEENVATYGSSGGGRGRGRGRGRDRGAAATNTATTIAGRGRGSGRGRGRGRGGGGIISTTAMSSKSALAALRDSDTEEEEEIDRRMVDPDDEPIFAVAALQQDKKRKLQREGNLLPRVPASRTSTTTTAPAAAAAAAAAVATVNSVGTASAKKRSAEIESEQQQQQEQEEEDINFPNNQDDYMHEQEQQKEEYEDEEDIPIIPPAKLRKLTAAAASAKKSAKSNAGQSTPQSRNKPTAKAAAPGNTAEGKSLPPKAPRTRATAATKAEQAARSRALSTAAGGRKLVRSVASTSQAPSPSNTSSSSPSSVHSHKSNASLQLDSNKSPGWKGVVPAPPRMRGKTLTPVKQIAAANAGRAAVGVAAATAGGEGGDGTTTPRFSIFSGGEGGGGELGANTSVSRKDGAGTDGVATTTTTTTNNNNIHTSSGSTSPLQSTAALKRQRRISDVSNESNESPDQAADKENFPASKLQTRTTVSANTRGHSSGGTAVENKHAAPALKTRAQILQEKQLEIQQQQQQQYDDSEENQADRGDFHQEEEYQQYQDRDQLEQIDSEREEDEEDDDGRRNADNTRSKARGTKRTSSTAFPFPSPHFEPIVIKKKQQSVANTTDTTASTVVSSTAKKGAIATAATATESAAPVASSALMSGSWRSGSIFLPTALKAAAINTGSNAAGTQLQQTAQPQVQQQQQCIGGSWREKLTFLSNDSSTTARGVVGGKAGGSGGGGGGGGGNLYTSIFLPASINPTASASASAKGFQLSTVTPYTSSTLSRRAGGGLLPLVVDSDEIEPPAAFPSLSTSTSGITAATARDNATAATARVRGSEDVTKYTTASGKLFKGNEEDQDQIVSSSENSNNSSTEEVDLIAMLLNELAETHKERQARKQHRQIQATVAAARTQVQEFLTQWQKGTSQSAAESTQIFRQHLEKILQVADSTCDALASHLHAHESNSNALQESLKHAEDDVTNIKGDLSSFSRDYRADQEHLKKSIKQYHDEALATARKQLASFPTAVPAGTAARSSSSSSGRASHGGSGSGGRVGAQAAELMQALHAM